MWDQYFKQDSDERRVINEEIEKLKTEKTSLMVCITVCALAQNLLLQDFGVNWFSLQPSAYSFHNINWPRLTSGGLIKSKTQSKLTGFENKFNGPV